jgi:hypothetical protein
MKPGTTERPPRSLTCASPLAARMDSVEPVATIFPPAIAIASTTRSRASTVCMLPLISRSRGELDNVTRVSGPGTRHN